MGVQSDLVILTFLEDNQNFERTSAREGRSQRG